MSENMIYCANGICYSMNSKCHYSLNSIFFKIIFAKAKMSTTFWLVGKLVAADDLNVWNGNVGRSARGGQMQICGKIRISEITVYFVKWLKIYIYLSSKSTIFFKRKKKRRSNKKKLKGILPFETFKLSALVP